MNKSSNKYNNRKKGDAGENIAIEYLLGMGFHVKERNFRRAWGEIDIICEKDGKLCFVEVKSIVSCENDQHSPEENVHGLKLRKMRRMIETYLWEKYENIEMEFRCYVIAIRFDKYGKVYEIKFIEDVVP